MFAPLVIAAAVLVGPELTPRASFTEPIAPYGAEATAFVEDFLVVFSTPHGLWSQRIDRDGDVESPRPMLVAETARTMSRFAVASSRNGALVVWNDDGVIRGVVLDAARRPVASPTVGETEMLYDEAVAAAAFDDGYLVLWKSPDRLAGQFVDARGTRIGAPLTIGNGAHADFATASNGSSVLVIRNERDGSRFGIAAYLVTPGGGVARTAFVPERAANLQLIWDGAAYVAYWSGPKKPAFEQIRVAAFDGNGALARDAITIGEGLQSGLAATGSGSTAFFTRLHDLFFVRLAPGGEPLDTAPRPIAILPPPPWWRTTFAAASNGHAHLLLHKGPVLTFSHVDDLDAGPQRDAQAVAFSAPAQSDVVVASGDSMLFVGWAERDRAAVVRFANGAFLEHDTTTSLGLLAIAADGDRAAVVSTGSGVEAHFVSADGSKSPAIPIGSSSNAPYFTWPCCVARAGESFVAVWSVYGPTSMGSLTYRTVQRRGTFPEPRDVANAIDFGGPSRYSAALVRAGTHAVIAQTNQTVRLSDVDERGVATNEIGITGPETLVYGLDLAFDGSRRFLVALLSGTEEDPSPRVQIIAVDAATRAIVRDTTLPLRSQPHVAWDGETFLLVTDDLDAVRITADGEPIGTVERIVTPHPPQSVRIASGLAGTAIVYTRPAPDLGNPTSRLFLRMVKRRLRQPHNSSIGW